MAGKDDTSASWYSWGLFDFTDETYFMYDLIIGLAILVMLIYLCGSWNHNYFKKRNIPFIKPIPFLGNNRFSISNKKKECFGDYILRIYHEFKGNHVGGTFHFMKPVVVVNDLKLIEDITGKDAVYFNNTEALTNSESLKPQPVSNLEEKECTTSYIKGEYSAKMLNPVIEVMDEFSRNLVIFLQQCIVQPPEQGFKIKKDGDKMLVLDLKDFYSRFYTDLAAKLCFGNQVDSLKDPKNEFFVKAKNIFQIYNFRTHVLHGFLPSVFPKLYQNGIECLLSSVKPKDFFRSLLNETLSEREKEAFKGSPIINLLLTSKKRTVLVKKQEETAKETLQEDKKEETEEETLLDKKTEDRVEKILPETRQKMNVSISQETVKISELNNDDLIAHTALFFMEGYYLTSLTLTFASYILAVNPDIQTKLQEEVDKTLKENDGKLDYDAIQSMKYLRNIMRETIRMFPPNVALERVCKQPYTLKTEPAIELQPGDSVYIPIYGVQHDPEYYTDPERFDPDRFNSQNKSNIQDKTYFPKLGSSCSLVGESVAFLENQMILVHLLSQFNIKVVSQTPLPFKLAQKWRCLTMQDGFWFGLELRKPVTPDIVDSCDTETISNPLE